MAGTSHMTPGQEAECRALAAAMDRVKSFPEGRKLITDMLLAICSEVGLAVVDKEEDDRIRDVLKRVIFREIGGKLYITADVGPRGFWSAEIPDRGRAIFEMWAADRATALGLPPEIAVQRFERLDGRDKPGHDKVGSA